MKKVIDEAVENSIKDNLSGKAITGYLMKYIKEKWKVIVGSAKVYDNSKGHTCCSSCI